ncbi:hypothetical protein [Microbacterium sp. BK668]|uniref:hypothetical protein n=1 Tax=Microbacterium sp. BK668 TaxID=2512118 RepID=UPI00105FD79D|nr:hypothetical protein [Microbacterium sp. BK668]TDN92176.1 hypothetical protein EV279_1692 [Microbacterium sp. BK668]
MREVQMFGHGEVVKLPTGETARVVYPASGPPVDFFDPLTDPFVLRAVNVLMDDGEVRRYLASELVPEEE